MPMAIAAVSHYKVVSRPIGTGVQMAKMLDLCRSLKYTATNKASLSSGATIATIAAGMERSGRRSEVRE
jgi:hypothetical protein